MIQAINTLLGRHPAQVRATVEIYTWQTCPYCIRAKLLLRWKGVKFQDYKIDGDETAREQMAFRSQGRRSVPQIFINQQHVGGCDDLYTLDQRGQLDALLATAATS